LPLLSTAGWLVKPLQQRSNNAAIVIEARTAFRPLLAGGPSGTMSFDRDALQHRGCFQQPDGWSSRAYRGMAAR
jgi:hypothetical protein